MCRFWAAIAMHYGSIAEMQTGEGKTLTAAMPLYLNALTGQPVHLVTVNDYLAQRDCEWIGSIFRWLGLTVDALDNEHPLTTCAKKSIRPISFMEQPQSLALIICATTRWRQSTEEQCQRGYFFAIIDEVDSILDR